MSAGTRRLIKEIAGAETSRASVMAVTGDMPPTLFPSHRAASIHMFGKVIARWDDCRPIVLVGRDWPTSLIIDNC